MDKLVFISYSSKDVVIANKIVEYLEGQGYPCWIAPRNITSGHDYTDMINDAIQNCCAVVLVVSGRALQSQWVKKEISTAVSYNKPILPYRIANVEITGGFQFLLNNVQWIDATGNPANHLPELVDGLEQRLPSTPPPKRSKRPLIIGLSAAALVVAGGGVFLWQGDNHETTEAADTMVQPVDTIAAPVTMVQQVQVSTPVTTPTKSERKATAPTPTSSTTVQTAKTVESSAKENMVDTPVKENTATVTAPDTTGQAASRRAAEAAAKAKAQEIAFQNKKKEALKFYNTQRYREALNLFEELRREKPQDKELGAYISDCRRMMAN